MSLVLVDNLLTEQKNIQNKQKDKQSSKKKLDKKEKFRISKYGFKRPTPIHMIEKEPIELNNCVEWQSQMKCILIKLLSLPAMTDRIEFEELIKNSNDINDCINQIPIFKFSKMLPWWLVSGLTYGALYMKVKTNKLINISTLKYDKIEKKETNSMINFTVIKPEK